MNFDYNYEMLSKAERRLLKLESTIEDIISRSNIITREEFNDIMEYNGVEVELNKREGHLTSYTIYLADITTDMHIQSMNIRVYEE